MRVADRSVGHLQYSDRSVALSRLIDAGAISFMLERMPTSPVLVVDDNPDTRDAISRLLQIRGYPVVTAKDGWEALTYLQEGGRASLIILDLYMPRFDGRRFRDAQLRDDALARIPVVVFTVAVGETLPDVACVVRKNDPAALLGSVERALGTLDS
jgi:two-component system, chemotaxis family, chemotaxis protein CheY